MSQQEKNKKRIEELEAAKSKLTALIDKLKQNPSLSEDELSELSGGTNVGCANIACAIEEPQQLPE